MPIIKTGTPDKGRVNVQGDRGTARIKNKKNKEVRYKEELPPHDSEGDIEDTISFIKEQEKERSLQLHKDSEKKKRKKQGREQRKNKRKEELGKKKPKKKKR